MKKTDGDITFLKIGKECVTTVDWVEIDMSIPLKGWRLICLVAGTLCGSKLIEAG